MEWFAHRGASDLYPENSLEAIEAAIPFVDGIEFDVHFSKDGIGMIIHDETLERTTDGRGRVVDHTYEELRMLDAGFRFKGEKVRTVIPTLDEVYALLAGTPVKLNVELKTDTIRYDGIEKYVIDRAKAHGIDFERLILSSFNHYSIAKVREIAPEIETGVLYPYPLYKPHEYAQRLGAKAIHPDYRRVLKSDVEAAHAAGIEVRVYTPRTEADVLSMAGMGIDAVIVNDPRRLKKVFD